MRMRIRNQQKIRVGPYAQQQREEAVRSKGRDVIFRTLMPGVLLFVVSYYAFIHSPAVADFYCNAVTQLAHRANIS